MYAIVPGMLDAKELSAARLVTEVSWRRLPGMDDAPGVFRQAVEMIPQAVKKLSIGRRCGKIREFCSYGDGWPAGQMVRVATPR